MSSLKQNVGTDGIRPIDEDTTLVDFSQAADAQGAAADISRRAEGIDRIGSRQSLGGSDFTDLGSCCARQGGDAGPCIAQIGAQTIGRIHIRHKIKDARWVGRNDARSDDAIGIGGGDCRPENLGGGEETSGVGTRGSKGSGARGCDGQKTVAQAHQVSDCQGVTCSGSSSAFELILAASTKIEVGRSSSCSDGKVGCAHLTNGATIDGDVHRLIRCRRIPPRSGVAEFKNAVLHRHSTVCVGTTCH